MEKLQLPETYFIGITLRTTNANGQAAKDIPPFWGKFMAEQIDKHIPNRIDEDIVAVYTNYESDYTAPYDMVLGCRVSTLAHIPEGMQGYTFPPANYLKFTAKGDLTKDAVIGKWLEIWDAPLDRVYTADYEVYGAKSMNPHDGEADIFISVK